MIPYLVLHHSVLNDAFRTDYKSPFQKSAKELNDFLIMRYADMKPKEKVAKIARQVIRRVLTKIPFYQDFTPQMGLAIEEYADIKTIMTIKGQLEYKLASIVFALLLAIEDVENRVIYVSNEKKGKVVDQIIGMLHPGETMSAQRKMKLIPFELMNTGEVIEKIESDATEAKFLDMIRK